MREGRFGFTETRTSRRRCTLDVIASGRTPTEVSAPDLSLMRGFVYQLVCVIVCEIAYKISKSESVDFANIGLHVAAHS